ncbi:glycosyltransferase [Gilvimarinus sp. F26214L]|uniref:glycosyltransferase n=1 Tax=Gilvimarinus sp. DZF01 TaxID=3461371 RepID=UPI004045F966
MMPAPPKRIVHIISGDRWAGAEVQAFTLLRQLRQHAEVHAILLNDGELARRCRADRIPITVLNENHMSSVGILRGIIACLKAIRPQVVHTHRQKENILGSLANLASGRARCIRTVHGAPEFAPNLRQRLQIWLDVLCGRLLQDGIIAVSSELKTRLGASFPDHKIHVIRNGIDPEEVRRGVDTPEFRRSFPNARHVGLVGRLDPVKRIDIFLRMAAILLAEAPHHRWHFHVFGEGRQEAALKQLAHDLNIARSVRFHGHRSDVRSCIAGLDALVMPSDHEGLPMAALEALALNTPLVAHDTGGLRELLIKQPECLVQDHEPSGYARALRRLIEGDTPAPVLAADYLAGSNADRVLALYVPVQAVCTAPG